MDIQCPAAIACLAPGESPPESVGGHRIVAAYMYDVDDVGLVVDVPVREAPAGKFWDALREIGDLHRGEGVALYAPSSLLKDAFLQGASLNMTSAGPERL